MNTTDSVTSAWHPSAREIANTIFDMPIERMGPGEPGPGQQNHITNLRGLCAWMNFAWRYGREEAEASAARHAGPTLAEIRQVVREELAAVGLIPPGS